MPHTQPSLTSGTSADVVIALTEYRMEMLDLLRGMELPQGVQMGQQLMTSSLEDKWPVSTGGIAYTETVADHPELTSWGEKFFTLTTKEYSAGAIAPAKRLRSTEWAAHGWGMLPQENAEAFMDLLEELLADTLEAGSSTASWMTATKHVFDTTKPCDPNDPSNGFTFDSLYTSKALSTANIAAMRTAGLLLKNAKGRPRGLRLSHIVAGADKEDALRQYLKDSAVVVVHGSSSTESSTMESNVVATHYPGIQPVILSKLTNSGVWYPVFSRSGRMPWLTLMKKWARQGNAPGMPSTSIQAADGLEWKMLDEMSDHYKLGSQLGPANTVAQWSEGRVGCAITDETTIWRCEP